MPPLATTPETHPSPIKDDTDIALSAIRDEVIGRIDNGSKPENDAKILELTEKTQQLEARIDKHQQDIATLLQLVRQTWPQTRYGGRAHFASSGGIKIIQHYRTCLFHHVSDCHCNCRLAVLDEPCSDDKSGNDAGE